MVFVKLIRPATLKILEEDCKLIKLDKKVPESQKGGRRKESKLKLVGNYIGENLISPFLESPYLSAVCQVCLLSLDLSMFWCEKIFPLILNVSKNREQFL